VTGEVQAAREAVYRSPSEGYRDNRYIHTQGGRFYACDPVWRLDAIAHALGQTARYRGNADIFYSVAEHSVLVSLLMEHEVGGDPFEGIHHDDTESILPDVSSPFKGLFKDLRDFDKKFLEPHMRRHWGLPETKTDANALADWLALFIESAQILPERGEDFEDPYKLRPKAMALRKKGWMVHGYEWNHAKGLYLARHEELSKRRERDRIVTSGL
jgi:hypothetical protein